MTKVVDLSGGGGRSMIELIDTIGRLGTVHRERLLQIILMLAEAPVAAQQVVQAMLRRFVDSPPTSTIECLAEVDAVISYLEAEVATTPTEDWSARRANSDMLRRNRVN